MRILLAALAVSLAAVGSAAAGPWSDPATGVSFTTPDGWTVTQPHVEGVNYMVAKDAAHECHVLQIAHPETASITPDRIRAAGLTPIASTAWTALPIALPTVFTSNDGSYVSSNVDTHGFWPLQRAEYTSGGKPLHAAIQFRPGMELWSFCWNITGADDAAGATAFLRSVGTVNDATLQAQAETLARAAQSRQAQLNNSHRNVMQEDNIEMQARGAARGASGQ